MPASFVPASFVPAASVLAVERSLRRAGNRDVVGFGINGNPSYQDMVEFPAPAVRFRENSAEVLALRELELGDWTALTLEQKKERESRPA